MNIKVNISLEANYTSLLIIIDSVFKVIVFSGYTVLSKPRIIPRGRGLSCCWHCCSGWRGGGRCGGNCGHTALHPLQSQPAQTHQTQAAQTLVLGGRSAPCILNTDAAVWASLAVGGQPRFLATLRHDLLDPSPVRFSQSEATGCCCGVIAHNTKTSLRWVPVCPRRNTVLAGV